MQDALPPLPNDLAICQQMIVELLATVKELRSDREQMQARIDWLVRAHFGRRSERIEGPTLFDEHPAPEPPPPASAPPEPEPTIVVKRPGHGRKSLPKELPRKRQEIDVSEAEKACPCCGDPRTRIGEDVSERLDYQPSSLFVRVIARPTYLCKKCEQQGDNIQAVQAPLPPEPIPRGLCAPGLLAYLIVSKWIDHLPLYRLESILGRLGWDVSRSTLCDQTMACAGVLMPLYDLMHARVKCSFALHTDDTHLTLLDPRRTAYAWVYVGDALNPYTVFDLTDSHQQEFPTKFLAGYQGYIHADGYTGYNPLYAAGATHVGCWMHTRRYFFEAKGGDPRAYEALARIRALYQVEDDAKDLKLVGAELAAYRREHAGPVLIQFADWLAEQVPKALPKSQFGEAIGYAINQWPSLIRFVDDGRLRIDNGPAERAIRPLAVGRRNWLHIAGDGGLRSGAVLLTIAASAKRHHVNPWEYIKHILTELPARADNADLTDLLPDVWASGKAATAAQ
jgi:transposase